ncbi:Ig-like domain-containing protein [Metabacillus sp. HB246100]
MRRGFFVLFVLGFMFSSLLPIITTANGSVAVAGEAFSPEFATQGTFPALSPDGNTVFVGKGRVNHQVENEYVVGMYDVKTAKLLKEIKSNNGSEYYSYSPNGKYLYSKGNSTIFLDGENGEQLFSLPYYFPEISFQETNDDLVAFVYSTSQTLLVSNKLVVYDLKNKEELFERTYDDEVTMKVALHPTEPIVAISRGLNIEIINYQTGTTVATINNPFNLATKDSYHAIRILLYSPDGKKLNVSSGIVGNHPLKQFDTSSTYTTYTTLDVFANEKVKDREGLPKKITYNQSHSELYLHSQGKMKLYDSSTRQYKNEIKGDLDTIVFSKDMKKIAYTKNYWMNSGDAPTYIEVKNYPIKTNTVKRIEFTDPYIQLRQGKSTYYGLEYINDQNQRVLLDPKEIKLEPFDKDIVEIDSSNKILAKKPGSTILKASYNGLVDYISIEVQSLSISKIIVDPLYNSSMAITGKAPSNITIFAFQGNRHYQVKTSGSGSFRIDLDKPLKENTTLAFMYHLEAVEPNSRGTDYLFENVIRDTVSPEPPVITHVNEKTGYVEGKTEPYASITTSYSNSINVASQSTSYPTTVKADKYGKFNMQLSAKSLGGKTLKTISKDLVGNKSKETVTKVIDKTPPSKPTVNTISDIATSVQGKAEAGSTVYVVKGSKSIGNGKSASNGTYTIKIPKQASGTTLTIYAVDAAKNKSTTTSVKVVKAPLTPTISTITNKTVNVSGKGTPSTTVYIKNGSKVIASGKVTSKGTYSLKIPKQKAGQKLTILAKSSAGIYSGTKTVTVK